MTRRKQFSLLVYLVYELQENSQFYDWQVDELSTVFVFHSSLHQGMLVDKLACFSFNQRSVFTHSFFPSSFCALNATMLVVAGPCCPQQGGPVIVICHIDVCMLQVVHE